LFPIFPFNYLTLITLVDRLGGEIARTNFHCQYYSYLRRVPIFVKPTVLLRSFIISTKYMIVTGLQPTDNNYTGLHNNSGACRN